MDQVIMNYLDYVVKQCWEIVFFFIIFDVNVFGLGVGKRFLVLVGGMVFVYSNKLLNLQVNRILLNENLFNLGFIQF